MEDTLDLLSEPGALAQLCDAKTAVEAGDYLTAEDLRAKYLSGDGKR
jgi:hypothetical protein